MTQEADRGRTFNTEVRSPWNSVIHYSLRAIDNHTREFLRTGDVWHEKKASVIREYVTELKDWIILEEGR